jgi:hypothetical protein
VVPLLGAGDLLELATVEEDPPATLALLDVDAATVDGLHHVLTLRANHTRQTTYGRSRMRGLGSHPHNSSPGYGCPAHGSPPEWHLA